MKKRVWSGILILIGAFLITTQVSFAKEKTIFKDEFHSGGYGGPTIRAFELKDKKALMVGGKGGWIINHAVSIGGGGYGVVNGIEDSQGNDLDLGYGGFIVGLIIGSDLPIHLELNSLIGAGSLGKMSEEKSNSDNFTIIEPAVNLEFNITSFFRISGGVSYKLVEGLEYKDFNSDDLEGLSVNVDFKFGSF